MHNDCTDYVEGQADSTYDQNHKWRFDRFYVNKSLDRLEQDGEG